MKQMFNKVSLAVVRNCHNVTGKFKHPLHFVWSRWGKQQGDKGTREPATW